MLFGFETVVRILPDIFPEGVPCLLDEACKLLSDINQTPACVPKNFECLVLLEAAGIECVPVYIPVTAGMFPAEGTGVRLAAVKFESLFSVGDVFHVHSPFCCVVD